MPDVELTSSTGVVGEAITSISPIGWVGVSLTSPFEPVEVVMLVDGDECMEVVGVEGMEVVGVEGRWVVGVDGMGVVGVEGMRVVGIEGMEVVGVEGMRLVGVEGMELVGEEGMGVVVIGVEAIEVDVVQLWAAALQYSHSTSSLRV